VWQSRRLSLSLCVKNGTWTSQGERYFFESLFTDPTSAAYAGIVTEATPLSTQQMKDLVLATVKDNPEIREVRDVSYSTRTINGHELGVLDYTVVLKRGVSFRYRSEMPVLRSVDLKIAPGAKIAVADGAGVLS